MRLNDMLFQTFLLIFLMVFSIPDTCVSQSSSGKNNAVKIGLLISDSTSKAAVLGAEMAIRKANENGGFNGRPFCLVVKSMEGPWGTGSKQTVDLVFNEKVWAILGSHDGRNAHLAEQVCAKTRVAIISAWTGDPTLAQAFVPWFFNCVPDYFRQASALAGEIYDNKKFKKIVTVSDYDYDSNLAFENFLKKIKSDCRQQPIKLSYSDTTKDFNILADRIIRSNPDCILLFGHPAASLKLIKLIRQKNQDLPVYGTFSLLDENETMGKDPADYKNIIITYPGNYNSSRNSAFRNEFYKSFSVMPGIVAAYAYDGMTILIKALQEAGGSDPEKIRKTLSVMTIEGVTGQIQFDNFGSRSGKCRLSEIKQGVPVLLESK